MKPPKDHVHIMGYTFIRIDYGENAGLIAFWGGEYGTRLQIEQALINKRLAR